MQVVSKALSYFIPGSAFTKRNRHGRDAGMPGYRMEPSYIHPVLDLYATPLLSVAAAAASILSSDAGMGSHVDQSSTPDVPSLANPHH